MCSSDLKRAGAYLGGKIQMVTGLSTGKPAKRQVFQLAVKDGEFEAGGECGLLGFAVHPDYAKHPQVFVYYSIKIGGKLHQRLSRFQLKPGADFEVDPASEQPLMTQLDPASNHNGGDVHFGPDGYLYFSCGDGGAGGDAFNNAGFINKGFHAGVYRIDVDKKPGNLPPNPHPSVVTDAQGSAYYAVPADNPFLGATSHRGQPVEPKTVRTEVWATGLRNPWRFSFDPQTGTCFAGDVGQNLFEEIDILVSGGDYGWSEIEGLDIYNRKDASAKQAPAKLAPESAFVAPIYEYDRKLGNSVTGGVVCRSERIPAIRDAYVFGDYASGRLLPSEAELSQTYSASRVTIRRALEALRAEIEERMREGKGPVTPDGDIEKEKFRVVVEGPPNWTSFRQFWKMFADEGAVAVASTYTKVGGVYDTGFRHDPDRPLESLAEYCLGCYTNLGLPSRIDMLAKYVRQ